LKVDLVSSSDLQIRLRPSDEYSHFILAEKMENASEETDIDVQQLVEGMSKLMDHLVVLKATKFNEKEEDTKRFSLKSS